MSSVTSEEDSVHLDTPPRGRGRCCADKFCLHPTRNFYSSTICDTCNGNPHEQGCFLFVESMFTRYDLGDKICLQCKHKQEVEEKKRKKKEKEDRRRFHKQLFKATNPFTIAANQAKRRKLDRK